MDSNKKGSCRILAIDCDGVLTDGKLTIDHTGKKLFKQFHTRDVRAIRELVAHGWEVYIVSADDGHASGKVFAEKVGAEFIYLRDKRDLKGLLSDRPFYAVGDDSWDVPMLLDALQGFCPSDADDSVKQLCNVIRLDVNGGTGVIAHMVYHIFKNLL